MKFTLLLTFSVFMCKCSAQLRIVGPPIYMGSSHDKPLPLIQEPPGALHVSPAGFHVSPGGLHVSPAGLHVGKAPLHVGQAPLHVIPAPLHVAPAPVVPAGKYNSVSLTIEPEASSSNVPIIDIEDLSPPPKLAYKSTNFKSGPSFYEPLANEDPLVVPPCNISKPGFDVPFTLMDNIFVPCNEPFILDAIRIGSPLPKGIKILKGTQQTIAIKIPSPTSSLVGVLASRNNIIQSNISSPIYGRRNPAYHRGLKVKNWKRQTDCKLAPKSQIDLITSLHTILTNEVRVKGAFAFSSKSNNYVKNTATLPPMQIHHIQSFGLSAPPLAGINEEDFRLADLAFGFRGARFEFDESWRTARMIEKTLGKNNAGNFSDRNYMSSFRELFKFATNAHMELHTLGEIQAKTVYRQEQISPLIKKSIGDPVILEPKYFRSGASFTSSICRGNY